MIWCLKCWLRAAHELPRRLTTMHLAAYACDPARTRGRRYPELAAPTRNDYQRDRDRIVHSTAFRRLVYKTQVFLNHEGDLFRTRLTHSLEVAQLGRSIARTLGFNEDLVEAIALAHDLGHTPFGHAGQDALHDCLAAFGGFEHNLQSLRVVDELEQRYPAYDGLNLTFETREGILKHCSRKHALELERAEPDGVGRRFLDGTQPSLEAQLCNLADAIAYNAHDVDDGVRSGLLSLDLLQEVEHFNRFYQAARHEYPGLQGRRLLFESIRRMLSAQVYDVIEATQRRISTSGVSSPEQVRANTAPLVCFSDAMRASNRELASFLFAKLYRHAQVVETTARAKQVVRELFDCYRDAPTEMPSDFAATEQLERGIADYIAGMTDRFAIREHERLTGRKLF